MAETSSRLTEASSSSFWKIRVISSIRMTMGYITVIRMRRKAVVGPISFR